MLWLYIHTPPTSRQALAITQGGVMTTAKLQSLRTQKDTSKFRAEIVQELISGELQLSFKAYPKLYNLKILYHCLVFMVQQSSNCLPNYTKYAVQS